MKINIEEQIEDYQLSEDDTSYLLDSVPKWQEQWYTNAEGHRQQRKNIVKAIVHNSTVNSETDIEDQDAEFILLPQVWEQFHTYKANVWKGNFSSFNTLLDVQGKDRASQETAPSHKYMLISLAREMDLQLTFDEMMDNWLIDGEIIAMVYWDTDVTKIRRKAIVEQPVMDEESGQPMIDAMTGQPATEPVEQFVLDDKVLYDGPKVKIIDSDCFTFDNTQKDKWDSCIKIYKSYRTFHELISDQVYDIDPDIEEFLYNSAIDTSSNTQFQTKDYNGEESKKSITQDNLIELLEVWGDIPLPRDPEDPEKPLVLKNWLITIANRQHIIRSEANPYVANPFVRGCFMEDTFGRGISPLSPTIPLNYIASSFLNMQLAAIALIINKPFLAPKGSMGSDVKVYPGAIIEFDAKNLQNTFMPVPLEFREALMPLDFLSVMESNIEASTGIYKYMAGKQDNRARSATESNFLVQGQNTRLGKEIAMLNLKVTIPMFKKIAEVYENNSFEDQEMMTGDPMNPFINIDQNVRSGNFSYFYGSQETMMEAEARYKEVLELLAQFQNQPKVMGNIEWDVLLQKWLNRKNIEFANEIVKPDMLNALLSTFSPEQQQGVRDMIAQMLQQYMMKMQAAQAMGGTPDGQSGTNQQGAAVQSPQEAQREPFIPSGGMGEGGPPVGM